MSGSELIWAQAWKVNPNMGQLETHRTIGWEGVEYIRADAVAETIRQAVQAEREACAGVATVFADALAQVSDHPLLDMDWFRNAENLLRDIAAAIRARGDA